MALPKIQEALDVKFLEFQGRYVITKQQVAEYYDVNIKTITRYIDAHKDELEHNGYVVCKGNELKEFKLCFGSDINVATKTTVLGVFDFRSFLNMGMLLTTSERAKQLRAMMLDVVIAVMNEKDNLRRTLYAEVLTAVSALENATAEAIKSKAAEWGVGINADLRRSNEIGPNLLRIFHNNKY